MTRKEKLAFAVVAALAMTSSGFAFGQSVNNVSSDQVIYACVTGVNGNITKVSNTPKTCPRGTTPISWNMVGPKGDQGLPGSAVAKGDKGDKGDKGEVGATGPEGTLGWEIKDYGSARVFEIVSLSSTPMNPQNYYEQSWVATVLVENAIFRWFQGNGAFSPLRNLDNRGDWTVIYYEDLNCGGSPFTPNTYGAPFESLSFMGSIWAVSNDVRPLSSMKSIMRKYSSNPWVCMNTYVEPSDYSPVMKMSLINPNLYSEGYGFYLSKK
jgi:hypothetical protein